LHPFTAAFLAALFCALLARLWLALRHIRCVTANRDALPPQFVGQITLDAHRKAADYTAAKTRLSLFEMPVDTALVLALTLGGVLQFLSEAWQNAFEVGSHAHGISLIVSVALISMLVDLPFDLYRTFRIEARFGFNRMSLGLLVTDMVKHMAVGAALGIPLAYCVLWLMATMGEFWWIYVWLTWICFNLLLVTLYPTLIAPWFNKFKALEDPDLRTRIEGLLARCGFRSRGLFVMDSSRRSSHGNAYFTGFGSAKRIVLFDTLLARLDPPETEAVLAHELGHFSRHHVLKRMAVLFAASLLLLWLLAWLMQADWFYHALGVQTRSTAMALLLFFVALPPFAFFAQPLMSMVSRHQEFEADAYAASHSRADDLAAALVKLYRDNAATLTPDPVYSAFYDSHPPAMQRITRLRARCAA
jgi:STE24 endopeptidase